MKRCYLCSNHSRDRILNELPVGIDGKVLGKVLLCGDCWALFRNGDQKKCAELREKARRDHGLTAKKLIWTPGSEKP